MRAQILASQDLYLHIASGRWIIEHRQIPDRGIFSGSMSDAPWVAHEWLASVGFAWLYDHLGWGGVLIAVSLALAIAIATVTLGVSRKLGPLAALFASLLAWGLCINHLVARPHVIALPFVAIWISEHVRARSSGGTPSWYLMPLMVLWANIHGSYMFGLGFTALFAAEAVFESDSLAEARSAARRWGIFFCAALVAAIVTPHGLSGLLFPIQLVNAQAALESVLEWQPSTIANSMPLFVWCALLGFLALWQGIRLPICRLIMLMVVLYMAFAHRRHIELLGLAAPLLLQEPVAEALSRAAPVFMTGWEVLARPTIRIPLLSAASVAVAASLLLGSVRVARGPDPFTPVAALAAVEAQGIRGPVLNAQNFGGYLVFRGIPPFVDGRVDMYGGRFMQRYQSLDEQVPILEQYRIAWTIFEPSSSQALVMDLSPGWKRAFADDIAVVHVRTGAGR